MSCSLWICQPHKVQNRSYPVGVLPIMAYTGRLRPKGVPFLGFRYMYFMAVKKLIKRSGVVVYSYFKGKCIDSSLKGYTYPK